MGSCPAPLDRRTSLHHQHHADLLLGSPSLTSSAAGSDTRGCQRIETARLHRRPDQGLFCSTTTTTTTAVQTASPAAAVPAATTTEAIPATTSPSASAPSATATAATSENKGSIQSLCRQ